jgi:hypothetical protein
MGVVPPTLASTLQDRIDRIDDGLDAHERSERLHIVVVMKIARREGLLILHAGHLKHEDQAAAFSEDYADFPAAETQYSTFGAET